ncbi:MAG: hypothetical protein BWY13_00138 [Euryarchaeota archaeon ADurb.Bin190]|nr:MAG: hypothetical protein BWY13_00138 [Euryarchaeota archaeon ADurb.Bin190]
MELSCTDLMSSSECDRELDGSAKKPSAKIFIAR